MNPPWNVADAPFLRRWASSQMMRSGPSFANLIAQNKKKNWISIIPFSPTFWHEFWMFHTILLLLLAFSFHFCKHPERCHQVKLKYKVREIEFNCFLKTIVMQKMPGSRSYLAAELWDAVDHFFSFWACDCEHSTFKPFAQPFIDFLCPITDDRRWTNLKTVLNAIIAVSRGSKEQ